MNWAIMHSQKGSEWKDHEYLKREGTDGHYEDGKYYYPDSYKGGRHLPKGENEKSSKKRDFGNTDRSNMQDWEKKVHEHLDKIIAEHPDMFKTGKDVVAGIMDEKNLQSVKNTLKAFGLNPDKMTDAEVKKLRKQIADYYDKASADEMESSSAKSSKSSKKSKSTKKEESKVVKEDQKDKKKETKKEENKTTQVNTGYYTTGNGPKERNHYAKEEARKKKKLKHSLVVSDDYLAHHGILGMRWGKQNGPPYPLGAGDHSASEKKAGWRKSLANGVKKLFRSKRQKELDKQAKRLSDEDLEKESKRIERETHYSKQSLGKQAKNMTDSELKAAVDRLQLEKRYVDLSSDGIDKGKNFTRKLLIAAGTTAATVFVTTMASKAGQAGASKIIDGLKNGAKKTAKNAAKNVVKKSVSKAASYVVNPYYYRKQLALPMR